MVPRKTLPAMIVSTGGYRIDSYPSAYLHNPLLTTRVIYSISASNPDTQDAFIERIRSIPRSHGHGSSSMGIVSGGLALASTCWSSVAWKWVVDSSGKNLATHTPQRPLPAVRFAHPDRTPHDILVASTQTARPLSHLLRPHGVRQQAFSI